MVLGKRGTTTKAAKAIIEVSVAQKLSKKIKVPLDTINCHIDNIKKPLLLYSEGFLETRIVD
jgi:hypothetical protein